MDTCLFGITAFEVLRESDRLLPGLMSMPRTAKLSRCGVPRASDISDPLAALGAATSPVHILVDSGSHIHAPAGIVRHVYSGYVPRRSLIRCGQGLLIPAPELCFVQLADSHASRRGMHAGDAYSLLKREIGLTLKGFELVGTYRLDPSSDEGFRTIAEPYCDKHRIQSMIDEMPFVHGRALARRVLGQVRERSHAPSETAMALLVAGPRRLGGMGFTGAVLNWQVMTPDGERYVDLGFPELSIGMEYKGRRYHPEDRANEDDRRVNRLTGCGITIFNVWHEDLARPQLFDALMRDVARAAGVRIRIRDAAFKVRQGLLRSLVLPPVTRYNDTA